MIDVYEYEGCFAGYSDTTWKVEIVELPEKIVCEIPHGRHIIEGSSRLSQMTRAKSSATPPVSA